MREHGLGPMRQGRKNIDPPDYGDKRYSKERRLFPWKKNYHGQRALCHMACFLREIDTEDRWVHTTPAKLGVTGSSIRSMLQFHYPIIFREYLDVTGNELTDKILMGRIGNMFRDNRNRTFCLGPEHPKQHKELQPILDAVWLKRKKQKAEAGIG